MKTFSLFLLSFLASLLCKAQTPAFDWVDGITGGSKIDVVEGNSVVTDAAGNVYVTGNFTGSVDFDPGPGSWFHAVSSGYESIFVLKVDAAGNMVWVRFFDGNGVGYHSAIAVDAAGNTFVTGQFTNTFDFDPGPGTYSVASTSVHSMFLVRLDAAGNFVYAKTLESTDRVAGVSITLDANDSIYIAGTFGGTVDFDPGPSSFVMTAGLSQNLFISKLDPAGNFIWAKEVLTPGYIAGNSITLDATGNILITGNCGGNIDFDPGSGTYMLGSATANALFLLKLDNAGNFNWAKEISCSGYAFCVRADAAGNVYSTGCFLGNADFDPGAGTTSLTSSSYMAYILRLDASGNFVRVIDFPGTGSTGAGIVFNAAGDLFATGSFAGTADFDPGPGVYTRTATAAGGYDMYCLKLNAGSGSLDWVATTAASNDTRGFAIATNAAGAAYTYGTFHGTTDFDPGSSVASLTSLGPGNIFLQKVHPDVSDDVQENGNENSIELYPNPAHNFIAVTNIPKAASINVCDITGRILLTQKNESASVQLDLQMLATGIYFVNITTGDERVTKKIVKQ